MEDYVILIVSLALMFTALVAVKMFKGDTKPKQAKREVQDSAHKEVISSKDLTITTLKDELRSIKGKLYRTQYLEAQEEEDQPESTGKPVTFEDIQALVNTKYPKYATLLPLVKKQVMDATQGMTMEQILTYVKQFTEGQQSQGPTDSQPQQWNPNWA